MEGKPAIYLGRIVSKKHFRAFVYGTNGEQKLVESWDEFEKAMESGIWFASKEEKVKTKSDKRKRKPKVISMEHVEDKEDVLPDDDSVFEVTDENK